MPRRFDHIDLRVPKLADVEAFYDALLPALGFNRKVEVEGWLQYESSEGDITEFFGVTAAADHIPNLNRIAFWAETIEQLHRLADKAREAGAREIEGPMHYEAGYHAVFFNDPAGNRLEICHRIKP